MKISKSMCIFKTDKGKMENMSLFAESNPILSDVP